MLTGLVSIFNVTDLPLILSGSSVYLFDPTGSVLSAAQSEGQERTPGAAVGRAYSFVNSDLPARFAHQFAPLMPLDTSKEYKGTILRLPLRTPTQVRVHPSAF
jgi:hypothetical protein